MSSSHPAESLDEQPRKYAASTPEGLFSFEIEKSYRVATMALSGELDSYGVPLLEDLMCTVEADGTPSVEVDLAQLSFMDSSGLNFFLKAADRAQKGGWDLQIHNANGAVGRLFTITGTGFLLDSA